MGAISLLVCGASLPQERPRGIVPEPAISLCAVLADAPKYEDKEIVVRGLYRMVIHGAVLIDNACSHTDVNLRESSGYKVNKAALSLLRSLTKKDRFRAVRYGFSRHIPRCPRGAMFWTDMCGLRDRNDGTCHRSTVAALTVRAWESGFAGTRR